MESGSFTLLTMTVTRLVSSFGSDALAAQHVGTQIEALSWLIGGGFSIAVTAFIGQNFGAGKWDRISRGFHISSLAMLFWGGAITAVMFFGGYFLIGLFLPEQHLRDMGADFLRILAASQVIICLGAAGSGFFRGMVRTIPASAVSILCHIARVPLCYYLASTPLGLSGIWWGFAIADFFRGGVIYGWAAASLKKRKARILKIF
jgi:Na+-driven multidrug efflux pump